MENDSINLPLDIYSKHLRSIGGIEFTQREIDILACLVREKSTRTIPSFLSIAARTVASHISRVRLKTGCSSQTSIIDFVERSGRASILKNQYYLSLCNQVSFEKQLKKIPKMGSAQAPLCLIVYEREQKDQYSFIYYLEDHLKLAGFQTEVKIKEGQKSILDFLEELETQQGNHILYIVPQSLEFQQIALGCDKEKCILLLPDKPEDSEKLDNIHYVDFSGTENYYFSFFKLLKKLNTDFNFEQIMGDFTQSLKAVRSLPETIESQIDFPSPATKNIKTAFFHRAFKKRSKIVSLVFLMISLIGIISVIAYWSLERRNAPSIRSGMPIPTESAFLNRPELLAQIDSKFQRKQNIQTVALVGIGGAGKTILARQYAQSQRQSLVWEMNAETKETLAESFEGLAYTLANSEEDQKILQGLQDIKDPTKKENSIIQFVKNHLKAMPNWFLIYDNVEKFIYIKKYFPEEFHTWGMGRVILTTRDENIQNNKHVNDMIPIEELDPKQKFSLFTKIIYGEKTSFLEEAKREEIEKFLEKIPSFPLDVSVAAYYLKATQASYKDYLENLKKYNNNFENIQKNLLKELGEYTKTRNGIIVLSLQHLMGTHKDFKEILLFISLLDSQKIPRNLINKYKYNIVVDDFIYNLKKYSLVTNESVNFSSDSTISMHRSTQAIILAYLVDQLTLEARDSLLSGIVSTIEGYINEVLVNEDFMSMRPFVSHLEAFLSHSEILNKELEGTIGGILGYIYNQLGDYEKSKKLLTKALSDLNQVDNKNPVRISKVLAFLGIVYSNLGEYEKASAFLEQSYVNSQNNLAENHMTITMALAHLGNLYRNIGQYDKSLDSLNKSLIICKKYFPENHVKVGSIFVFLGHLYITLGNTDNALILLKKALKIYKQNVLEDDVSISWILCYLGSAYLDLGNYKEAQDVLEQSLTISKKHFHDNHPWTHWVLIDLGLTYSKLGDHKKGIALLETSLKGYEAHYGKDHLETAGVLKNLGRAYFAQGSHEIAEKFLNKALSIFQKNKHPESYPCLENLSDLYLRKVNEGNRQQSQSLREKALTYLKQALEVVKAHFPADSLHIKRIQEKLKTLDDE